MDPTTIEDYIALQVNNGTSTNRLTQVLEPGEIIGVFSTNNAAANAGVVRARILDKSGREIVKMQDIRAYAQRNAAYHKSYKPIRANGGEQVTVEIVATANFGANYLADFIFVIKPLSAC